MEQAQREAEEKADRERKEAEEERREARRVRVYAVCPRRVVCGAARGVFMGNRVADAPGGGPNMMSGVNDRRCRQWSTECLVIVSGLTGQ